MDLKNIKTSGRWSDSATDINDNFSLANVEIEKLKDATVSFKGYYSTPELLTAAYPAPVVGNTAWVGSPYPGVVYKCQTAGAWTATTDVPSEQEVDLGEYATKSNLTQTEFNFLPDRSYSGHVNIHSSHVCSYQNGTYIGYTPSPNYDAGWVQIFNASGTLTVEGNTPTSISFFSDLNPSFSNWISASIGVNPSIPSNARLAILNFDKANQSNYFNLRVIQLGAGAAIMELNKVKREDILYNCHVGQQVFTPFTSINEARLAVPIDPIDGISRRRRKGIIITYLLDTGYWRTERRIVDETESISWISNDGWAPIYSVGTAFVKDDNYGRRIKYDRTSKTLTFPANTGFYASGYPEVRKTLTEDLTFTLPSSIAYANIFIKRDTQEIVVVNGDSPQQALSMYNTNNYIQLGSIYDEKLALNGCDYTDITSIQGKRVKSEGKVRFQGQSLFKYNSVSAPNLDEILDIKCLVLNKETLYHPDGRRKRFCVAYFGINSQNMRYIQIASDKPDSSGWDYFLQYSSSSDNLNFRVGNHDIIFNFVLSSWPAYQTCIGADGQAGNVLSDHIFTIADSFSADLNSDFSLRDNSVFSYAVGHRIGVFVKNDLKATFRLKSTLKGDLSNAAAETTGNVVMRWIAGYASADGILADLRFRVYKTSEYAYTPGIIEFMMFNFLENSDGVLVKRVYDNMLWENGIFEKDLFSIRVLNPATADVGCYVEINNQAKTVAVKSSANAVLYQLDYSTIDTVTGIFEALKQLLPVDKYEILSYGTDGYASGVLPSVKIIMCQNKTYYENDVSTGTVVPDSYPSFIPAIDFKKEINVDLVLRPNPDVAEGAILSVVINDFLLYSVMVSPENCAKFIGKMTNIYLGRHSESTALINNNLNFNSFQFINDAVLPAQHIHYYFHNIYDVTTFPGVRIKELDGVFLDVNNNPYNLPGVTWPDNSHTTYGRFSRLLKTLKGYGFVHLTASEDVKCRRGQMKHPGKAFTFHFDDGQYPYDYPCIRELFAEYNVKPVTHVNSLSKGGTNFLTDTVLNKIHGMQQIGYEIAYHGMKHYHVNWMTYQQMVDFLNLQKADFATKGLSADKFGYAFSNPSKQNIKVYQHLGDISAGYLGGGYDGNNAGSGNYSQWLGDNIYYLRRIEASDRALFDGLMPTIKGIF